MDHLGLLISKFVIVCCLLLNDVYEHIEGLNLQSSSQYVVYYAGGRVVATQRFVINFGCHGKFTLVISDAFWGVHQNSGSSASYYLPGDCTSQYTFLTSDCSKKACTINTTTPAALPCLRWKGSKVPQYLHINYFCRTDDLKTFDICHLGGYTTSAGYITTPGQGIVNTINDCSCILTPVNGRSDTTIRVMDFIIQKNIAANGMCPALMQIDSDEICRMDSIVYSAIAQSMPISIRKIHDSSIQLSVQLIEKTNARFVFHFQSNITIHLECGTNLIFLPIPITSVSSVLISTLQTNTQETLNGVETTAPTSRIPSTSSRTSTETETHEASSMADAGSETTLDLSEQPTSGGQDNSVLPRTTGMLPGSGRHTTAIKSKDYTTEYIHSLSPTTSGLESMTSKRPAKLKGPTLYIIIGAVVLFPIIMTVLVIVILIILRKRKRSHKDTVRNEDTLDLDDITKTDVLKANGDVNEHSSKSTTELNGVPNKNEVNEILNNQVATLHRNSFYGDLSTASFQKSLVVNVLHSSATAETTYDQSDARIGVSFDQVTDSQQSSLHSEHPPTAIEVDNDLYTSDEVNEHGAEGHVVHNLYEEVNDTEVNLMTRPDNIQQTHDQPVGISVLPTDEVTNPASAVSVTDDSSFHTECRDFDMASVIPHNDKVTCNASDGISFESPDVVHGFKMQRRTDHLHCNSFYEEIREDEGEISDDASNKTDSHCNHTTNVQLTEPSVYEEIKDEQIPSIQAVHQHEYELYDRRQEPGKEQFAVTVDGLYSESNYVDIAMNKGKLGSDAESHLYEECTLPGDAGQRHTNKKSPGYSADHNPDKSEISTVNIEDLYAKPIKKKPKN